MIHTMRKVGTVLREARAKEGWSQTALAKHIGVSIFTLNRIEHDNRRFEMSWIRRLPPGIRIPVAKQIRENLQRQHNYVYAAEFDGQSALEGEAA